MTDAVPAVRLLRLFAELQREFLGARDYVPGGLPPTGWRPLGSTGAHHFHDRHSGQVAVRFVDVALPDGLGGGEVEFSLFVAWSDGTWEVGAGVSGDARDGRGSALVWHGELAGGPALDDLERAVWDAFGALREQRVGRGPREWLERARALLDEREEEAARGRRP